MATKEQIIEILRAMKIELCKQYRLKEIGVFGSVARGEQNEASDIDLLVEFDDGADLLDMAGLSQCLEERLKHKVDILSKRALRGEFREVVMREFMRA